MQSGIGEYQDGAFHRALLPKGHGRPLQLGDVLRKPDFLVTWLVPFSVFAFLAVSFTYGFMQLPSVCVLLSVAFLLASAMMLLYRRRGHVLLPLGTATFVAACAGTLVGLYLHDQYACYPSFYANSRLYTNVVPSQPSAAVADAGKITFSSESIVATNLSVAYISESGYTYCVAPIRDNSPTPRVEFWAVGIACCDEVGGFNCDQANDPSAHAGIRIFDNMGFFADSNADYFLKARLKAEAAYALISAAKPMNVRWVREDQLDMLSNSYRNKAFGALFGLFIAFLMASAVLAFAMYSPRK